MRKKSFLSLFCVLIAFVFILGACKDNDNDDNLPGDITYSLNATTLNIIVGEEKELIITPTPTSSVVWESSDDTIVSVTEGVVKGVALGSSTVTAKIGEITLSCEVTVVEYYLNYIEMTLETGDTQQLNVTSSETIQTIEYNSGNSEIATVSADGLITAISVGSTDISVIVNGHVLKCSVTVRQKYTYSLNKTEIDIAVGGKDQISVICAPSNSDPAIHVFSSENEDIATVNPGSGVVTGIAKGVTNIICSVNGEELVCEVVVTEYSIDTEINLFINETYDIVITQDSPVEGHTYTAVFESDNTDYVTVDEKGTITPVASGTANVKVKVGGKEFYVSVTVLAAHTLNEEEITLELGENAETFTLAVIPAMDSGVTFTSSDESIAKVDKFTGVVTAAGFGTCTITATIEGEDPLTCTVNVIMPAEVTSEDVPQSYVNLSLLSSEYKTLDWIYYNPILTEKYIAMNGGNLIGDVTLYATEEPFWDYSAIIDCLPSDLSAEELSSIGNTYGRAIHGSYSVSVAINNNVSQIVLFTGAWKETATVQFKLDNTVLGQSTFVGNEIAARKKVIIDIDTAAVSGTQTLTIDVLCDRMNDGNVSLVALAVIGKNVQDYVSGATGSITKKAMNGDTVDLTSVGTTDWIYSKNHTETVHKAEVPENSVINRSGIIYYSDRNLGEDYNATFVWSDGTEVPIENLHNFFWANDGFTIPVNLTKGRSDVTLYLVGFNSTYFIKVKDNYGKFVAAEKIAAQNGGNQAFVVTVSLDVDVEGEYEFTIDKARGEGNIGWAAVAVANANEYKLKNVFIDLTLDGNNSEILEFEHNGSGSGSIPTPTFISSNDDVAVVNNDGTVTAEGKGTAVITCDFNNFKLKAYVTVTEYTINNSETIYVKLTN